MIKRGFSQVELTVINWYSDTADISRVRLMNMDLTQTSTVDLNKPTDSHEEN